MPCLRNRETGMENAFIIPSAFSTFTSPTYSALIDDEIFILSMPGFGFPDSPRVPGSSKAIRVAESFI